MIPRLVFMGSPEFALPTLGALARSYPVVGVVTQPDRPAGRGRNLTPPPVKILAEALGLPVIQPVRLKESQSMQQLHDWQPDLIVVAAFGQILHSDVLVLPPKGCINVHASLLPRWRGAAPIPAAILHGDSASGVTIMRMDKGVDTGAILSQRVIPIHPEETTGTLTERLGKLGAELLVETLPDYLDGRLQAKSQDEKLVTYAPMIHKEDGILDFTCPAFELARRVRAFNPWPGAYTFWRGQRLIILKTDVITPHPRESIKPGFTIIHENQPAVGTIEGLLILKEVQPAGKKVMSGKAFLQGVKGWQNSILGKLPSSDNNA